MRQQMLEWQQREVDGLPISSSVTDDEAACLQELAKGQYVLEIGSGFGYSAIVMAETAKHVTAVDPHAGELPDSYEAMVANLEVRNLTDKVTIVREYSQVALQRFVDGLRCFGLIFIDGNHDEQVYNDVHQSLKLLTPGGHIAVHDLYEYYFPDIARVLGELGAPLKLVDTLWVSQSA